MSSPRTVLLTTQPIEAVTMDEAVWFLKCPQSWRTRLPAGLSPRHPSSPILSHSLLFHYLRPLAAFLPPFAIARGSGARVGCWRKGQPFPGVQELSQGVGPSKSWERAGSHFHSGQPMAAKVTSHGHDQGLRWPQQALGDRMAEDSLIRPDSSP